MDGLTTKIFDKNSFASEDILSNYKDDISKIPLLTSAYIFYTVVPLNGRNPVNKKWAITPIDQTSLGLAFTSYSLNPSGDIYGAFKIVIGSFTKILLISINLMVF